jgi:hypothetical protein
MKRIVIILGIICATITAQAQLVTPPEGGSAKAMVYERIGLTDVTIDYSRPAVKGREGRIWGDLVHKGFKDLGFGTCKECPWRAGANENTTIDFSTEVFIEGKPLPAGKYGLFIAYEPDMATVIFSSNTSSWGSYYYDKKEDVLRVIVKPAPQKESKERLTYEFSNETDSTAVVSLIWEKMAIPFKVTTQLQKLQLASFERELRGVKGFDPHSLMQVAEYMLDHNMRLNDALDYISRAYQSMPTFSVLMVKSRIEEKLNMPERADSSMQLAISRGSAQELHAYARQLLRDKQPEKAYPIFLQNYKRHPMQFMTIMGMARGSAAVGKKKDALKYARMALVVAPDEVNRKMVEDMIVNLEAGKDI